MAATGSDLCQSSPPHARGWTFIRIWPVPFHPLSPARAGMDPPAASTRLTVRPLPRTRGDGPSSTGPQQSAPCSPPHARGWTLGHDTRQTPLTLSPARAGMDPARSGARRPPRPLPRTRGDGPFAGGGGAYGFGSPPHARGWTHRRVVAVVDDHLSPARAGMDPSPRSGAARRHPLPRTRGDGPSESGIPSASLISPPHARGWTRFRHAHWILGHLSPARAGMDPRCRRRRCGRCPLPRTRGDGPPFDTRTLVARGSPPHARGWTHVTGSCATVSCLSPARAGMDPRSGVRA